MTRRRLLCVLAFVAGATLLLDGCDQTKPAEPPAWAYPVSLSAKPPADDGVARHLPDSSASFTSTQLHDLNAVADWRPDSHPLMPDVVARGRKPDVKACAYCHLPTGDGRPENASLAGLSYPYIVQQMADFKSGARRSSVPGRVPPKLMISIAAAATDADVAAAATYFSALKPHSFVQVIESERVPRTVAKAFVLTPQPGGAVEPIGARIIETPEDFDRFELRDERARYRAYVPPGSLAQGETIVTSGAGRTMRCTTCHGVDLKGTGIAPRLAGRSPSYLVRQLYDFRSGARAGPNSAQMKPVVARLTDPDIVAIAAYLASRAP